MHKPFLVVVLLLSATRPFIILNPSCWIDKQIELLPGHAARGHHTTPTLRLQFLLFRPGLTCNMQYCRIRMYACMDQRMQARTFQLPPPENPTLDVESGRLNRDYKPPESFIVKSGRKVSNFRGINFLTSRIVLLLLPFLLHLHDRKKV